MRPACRPALDPGDLCDPSGQGLRAGQGLPRRTARHTEHHLQPRSRELNYKIEVSTVPGDGHTCLTSAPFRVQAPGPVSGQLYAAIGEGPDTRATLSCRLSATGIRFLGILSRPGLVPLLRSAYHAAVPDAVDPSEVSTFR